MPTIIDFSGDHWVAVRQEIDEVAEILTPGEWARFTLLDGETAIVCADRVRVLKSFVLAPPEQPPAPDGVRQES